MTMKSYDSRAGNDSEISYFGTKVAAPVKIFEKNSNFKPSFNFSVMGRTPFSKIIAKLDLVSSYFSCFFFHFHSLIVSTLVAS